MFKNPLLLQKTRKIFNDIKGIAIIYDYINQDLEQELLNYISNQEYNTSINRRTQHYGFIYDYHKINTVTKTIDIPDIYKELFKNDYDINENSQIIINEYLVKQGIANHIDAKIFDNKIMSLSLGSDIAMVFTNIKTKEYVQVLLPRRSLLIIQDEARYNYYHGINKATSDINVYDTKNDKLVDLVRKTRISITIRNLKRNII